MFSECANPSCRVKFDYGKGQFYRFYKRPEQTADPLILIPFSITGCAASARGSIGWNTSITEGFC